MRLIAKGLKKCQDKSFEFSNFIRISILLQLIEFNSTQNEFAQACTIAFLFSFRVPSETLALRRAFRGDQLLVFDPQKEKASIDVVKVGEQDFLVVKLTQRKNLTTGCILKRPCFCPISSDKAAFLCPVHSLWPHIRNRVPSGEKLLSAVNPRNFNRILKRALEELRIPDASRYSSHAFRRGATQELREFGSGWPVIMGAGVWNSSACTGYVEITPEVETGVRLLFLNACSAAIAESDTSSAEEQ